MNKLISQLLRCSIHDSVRSVCQNKYSQLTQKNCAPRPWRTPNPGVEKRLKIIKEDTVSLDSQEFENIDIEDLESDFMQVGEMYNEHSSEVQNRKEKNQLQIVKRKYFKTGVQPNFLTWNEKEQIRYLHDSDSVEWSIEKLAANFPASESVIRKIIKARWKPEDSSSIQRHDKGVHKNWQLLFRGNIEVEPNLKNHLLKFSKRNKVISAEPNNCTTNLVCETSNSGTKTSEFLNIIKAYKDSIADSNLTRSESLITSDMPSKNVVEHYSQIAPREDTYTIDGSRSRKTDEHFTLSHYRQSFNTLPEDKYIQHGTVFKGKTSVDMDQNHSIQITNARSGVAAVKSRDLLTQNDNTKHYPEKITIPKNKWKEGGTYKVGDCFYDDDGTFLYRVPGMT